MLFTGGTMILTDKEVVIRLNQNMMYYYVENIGKRSEITGALITPKMIALCTERILELGGTIPTDPYEMHWKEITQV